MRLGCAHIQPYILCDDVMLCTKYAQPPFYFTSTKLLKLAIDTGPHLSLDCKKSIFLYISLESDGKSSQYLSASDLEPNFVYRAAANALHSGSSGKRFTVLRRNTTASVDLRVSRRAMEYRNHQGDAYRSARVITLSKMVTLSSQFPMFDNATAFTVSIGWVEPDSFSASVKSLD